MKFFLLVMCILSASVFGNLQIYPTRVVLTDQKRVARITLRHLGLKSERYRISPIFLRMKVDGSLEPAAEPKDSERAAITLLRFSPREVVLRPKMEQVVKVMLSGPTDLAPGEYRAHIQFSPIVGDNDKRLNSENDQSNTAVGLEPIVSVNIPVIYRRGNVKSSVRLSNLRYISNAKQGKVFALDVVTRGNSFPYGDFSVVYTRNDGDYEQEVGVVRGVSSYLPSRVVFIPVQIPIGKRLSRGKLRAEFRAPLVEGGRLINATEFVLR